MPIRDQAAQERSLDNDYGPTRGPNSPASFEVAFFAGDPLLDGVEVPTDVDGAETGYLRAILDNDDWEAAADGVKQTLPIQFVAPTGEWPDTVTHAALIDPATGDMWDTVELEEPLDVTGPGVIPPLVLPIFYDNNLD